MTISEAQKAVDKWIQEIGKRYFSPLTNMALLTEETGELARVIARTYGDQVAKEGDLRHPENSKEDIGKLFGDILFCIRGITQVAGLCNLISVCACDDTRQLARLLREESHVGERGKIALADLLYPLIDKRLCF